MTTFELYKADRLHFLKGPLSTIIVNVVQIKESNHDGAASIILTIQVIALKQRRYLDQRPRQVRTWMETDQPPRPLFLTTIVLIVSHAWIVATSTRTQIVEKNMEIILLP